jgi:hypothetical protein
MAAGSTGVRPSARARPRPPAPVFLATVVVGLLLAGCGSGSGSDDQDGLGNNQNGGSSHLTRERIGGCEPIQQPFAPSAHSGSVKVGSVLVLDADKLESGSGEVRLRPLGFVVAKRLTAVAEVEGTRKEVVFAAPGSRFVGMVFSVTNDSSRAIPVGSFGTTFRILAGKDAYAPVTVSPECAAASPAMASSPDLPESIRGKLAGPGFILHRGDEAQTVLVYSVPAKRKPSKWFSPLFEETVMVSSPMSK